MMAGLTSQVVAGLTAGEKAVMDEALAASSLTYDAAKSEPNIEVIADTIIGHSITTMDPRFSALEAKIRQLITEVILGISKPKLDTHVRFLELLRNKAFGRPCCVHIITTNYDLLFELAGQRPVLLLKQDLLVPSNASLMPRDS